MNVTKSTLPLAAVLLLGASFPASGQSGPSAGPSRFGDYDYGPRAGALEFSLSGSGSNDESFDRGVFSVAGSLGYFFSEAFEAGARHNMIFFDSDETDASFAATSRLFADYHFDLGRLRPFLGANVGLRYGDDGVDETGTAAPEWGLKLFVLEDTFVLGMMEYQIFFEDVDDADDRTDDGQFVYTVGIGFNF